MKRCLLFRWAVGLTALTALLLSGCVTVEMPLSGHEDTLHETRISGEGQDKILWLNLHGLMSSRPSRQALGLVHNQAMTTRVSRALDKAEKDDRIKALVLHIDSPGGTVTASDEIFDRIQRYAKKADVPVVASLGGVAASGGYYVAASADRIVAAPTTLTGSIGVIIMDVNAAGLMKKLGLSDTSVTSGPHKDIMSPLRPPRDDEEAILQDIVNDLYQRFVDIVIHNRPHLDTSRIDTITDGRIFTAPQAQALGLVDHLGHRERAIASARQLANLDQARVIRYYQGSQPPDTLNAELDSHATQPAAGPARLLALLRADDTAAGPQPLYLWRGAQASPR